MKTFFNINLLIIILCTRFSFGAEAPTAFFGEYLTHQVSFNSESENITQEEFDKIDTFINEIAVIDIERISIVGSDTNDEALALKRAELIKEIIADYELNEYLISTVNTKEVQTLTPIEIELLNALDALNEKIVIVVAPRRLVAGSFFADDITVGETFTIENIQFDAGMRSANEDSMIILEDLADFLTSRDDIYFTVQGHVCCVDPGIDARDNETGVRNLSVMRAKFVHDYLIAQGVDASRVSYEGLKGDYSLGRSAEEDRRVEILIRKLDGETGSAY